LSESLKIEVIELDNWPLYLLTCSLGFCTILSELRANK